MEYIFRVLKQILANEHLTMQIARQIYQISTAENGIVFFQMVHLHI